MGLSLQVGYLADLLANDEEGAASFREELARLNEYLPSVGIPPHDEPEECKAFSCDMYGYSGLHYVRRIAAHLDLRGVLPSPGDDTASKDPVLQEYYRLAERSQPGLLGRLFGRTPRARTYDHLIVHGDSEGFYLPHDFASVLFPPEKLGIAGGMIGSSNRLLDECRRIAAALELPLALDPEADEVWEASDSQGKGDLQWQRYGIESFCCLRLHAASQHSLKTGAAIVFC